MVNLKNGDEQGASNKSNRTTCWGRWKNNYRGGDDYMHEKCGLKRASIW